MKGDLKSHLIALHDGETLVLATKENQYGDQVPVSSIFFEDGRWMKEQINCWSSLDLGLGTCRCNSHPPRLETVISRKEMLSFLRQHLREEREENEARQAEIAWLEKTISELEQ